MCLIFTKISWHKADCHHFTDDETEVLSFNQCAQSHRKKFWIRVETSVGTPSHGDCHRQCGEKRAPAAMCREKHRSVSPHPINEA